MAVVQPYFDPTTLLQGGSIFSAYLQGFVKERSAMNRQMMELALAQADPKELYDQLESINKQIEALREFKYEVSTGRASGQQLTSQVVGIFRSAYEAELDRGTAVEIERAKQGGAAPIVYEEINNRYSGAKSGLPENEAAAARQIINKATRPQDGNMGRKAFLNIVEKDSDLAPGIKTEIMTQMQATEAEKTEAQTLNRESFIKLYKYEPGGADTRKGAREVYEDLQKLGVLKSSSSGRPQGLKDSDKEAIDKEIQSLEEERKQLKQQLEAARSGNVDIFQSFSGNYGLDNPFINVKTAYVDQPGVFAIASAVQDSRQAGRMVDRGMAQGERDMAQDERKVFRDVERVVERMPSREDYERADQEVFRDVARAIKKLPTSEELKQASAPSSYFGEYGDVFKAGMERRRELRGQPAPYTQYDEDDQSIVKMSQQPQVDRQDVNISDAGLQDRKLQKGTITYLQSLRDNKQLKGLSGEERIQAAQRIITNDTSTEGFDDRYGPQVREDLEYVQTYGILEQLIGDNK